MKRWCFPLVLLVVLGSALADSNPQAIEVYAEWKMNLDAGGKVTSLNFKPGQVKDVLRERLETAIRGWSFEPGAINGKPAETSTTLLVNMSISPKPDDEGYEVTLTSVRTGGSIANIARMPSFSESQARRILREKYAKREKKNPLVMVLVAYDESGKPENVEIADNSPVRKGSFAESALNAVRTWTFEPERVAGKGLRAMAVVPICFVVVTSDPTGRECEREDDPAGVPTDIGQSLALDSSVTLKSDVIGSTL